MKLAGRTKKSPEQIARLVEANRPYRWKPGQSGNPSGRPAIQKLSAAIRNILGQSVPGLDGVTYAELIAETLAEKAAAGDVRAAEILADRAEGRPSQSLDLQVTQLTERFEKMSREELLKYAQTGELPTERGRDEENGMAYP